MALYLPLKYTITYISVNQWIFNFLPVSSNHMKYFCNRIFSLRPKYTHTKQCISIQILLKPNQKSLYYLLSISYYSNHSFAWFCWLLIHLCTFLANFYNTFHIFPIEISEHSKQHIINIVIILQIVKCVNLWILKLQTTYEEFYFQSPQTYNFLLVCFDVLLIWPMVPTTYDELFRVKSNLTTVREKY